MTGWSQSGPRPRALRRFHLWLPEPPQSSQRLPVEIFPIYSPGRQSLCEDGQTEWPANLARDPCLPSLAPQATCGPGGAWASGTGTCRGVVTGQGWRSRLLPLPVRSLGTLAPNGWGGARTPGLTSPLHRAQPGWRPARERERAGQSLACCTPAQRGQTLQVDRTSAR